jgi:hypothetical protein
MNTRPFVFALLAAGLPLVANAQQTPPGGPPPPAGPMSCQMRDFMEQAQRLHQHFRTQMLSALTPEHRQLLAQIAGQLATSTNPDPKAAAAQLDQALSPGEKQAIVKAEQSFRSQMRTLHDKMRAQVEAQHPAFGKETNPDPGLLLLDSSVHTQMGGSVMFEGGGPLRP